MNDLTALPTEYDPARPEYHLAERLQRILYGTSGDGSLIPVYDRIRIACRVLDEHQADQRDRFDMLSEQGARRVAAAWALVNECAEVAFRTLLIADDPNAASWEGGPGEWAYHQLGFLSQGKWEPAEVTA